jgi:hypothetical protein
MHAIGFGPRFVVNRRGAVPAAFDFSGGMLPPGATFARASAATMTDASGAIVGVAADTPRFDYRGGRLRGLLLEPASSNALSYSADWTNAYWSRVNVGGTSGSLVETLGASAAHQVRAATSTVPYTAGAPVTLSAIASERSGSAKRYLVLWLGAAPAFTVMTYAIFDLATGAVTVMPNATAGTIALDNGAWLCWASAAPAATASGKPSMMLTASATVNGAYAGDGVSGLNLTDIQFEPGTVASSRIVTAGGPATRAADALTLDWGAHGVADGSVTVRYGFDDGSTQDVVTAVSGGTAAVPTSLARRWLVRAQKI